MMSPSSKSNSALKEFHARWTMPLFLACLAIHLGLASFRWEQGFMGGHEFRQAQTALITEYIDKQNNFGIDYETPILGKPWAFPLEYPLYQWMVVGVHRTTGWEIIQSARSVSLLCFYSVLPAVWIALGLLGFSRSLKWLVLAVTLLCPAHIFYSRAVLIDPLALALSAWFLATFLAAMQRRKWLWWLIAAAMATAAVLVKSLILVVWAFPAAIYGFYCLLQAWKTKPRLKPVGTTLLWGVGLMIPAFVAGTWWVAYTDSVKAAHPSAWVFTSEALAWGNYGTFSLSSRASWETWQVMAERWGEALISPWLLGGLLVLGIGLAPEWRKWIAGAALVWLFGQLAFPYAYAYQDYYFYAGAVFLAVMIGLIIAGIWTRFRGSAVIRWGVLFVTLGGMLHAYFTGYFEQHRVVSPGGSALTRAFRDLLPKQTVMMIVGEDWAAITPYRSQRRALMVRMGLEHDRDYLTRAIRDLDDEDLSVLVITGEPRNDASLVEFLVGKLGLVSTPILEHHRSTVYVDPTLYHSFRTRILSDKTRYAEVRVLDVPQGDRNLNRFTYPSTPGRGERAFSMIKPSPYQFSIRHGYGEIITDGKPAINVHPNSDLWIQAPEQAGKITWTYGMADSAWQREGGKSDGIEFVVLAESESGDRRELFRDDLNPATDPEDAGPQTSRFDYAINNDEVLVFATRPLGHGAFDWSYTTEISVNGVAVATE